jgi:hypothetical protein
MRCSGQPLPVCHPFLPRRRWPAVGPHQPARVSCARLPPTPPSPCIPPGPTHLDHAAVQRSEDPWPLRVEGQALHPVALGLKLGEHPGDAPGGRPLRGGRMQDAGDGRSQRLRQSGRICCAQYSSSGRDTGGVPSEAHRPCMRQPAGRAHAKHRSEAQVGPHSPGQAPGARSQQGPTPNLTRWSASSRPRTCYGHAPPRL